MDVRGRHLAPLARPRGLRAHDEHGTGSHSKEERQGPKWRVIHIAPNGAGSGMSTRTASKSTTTSSTFHCSFSYGLAESNIELHGTPWNNSIVLRLFLHAGLDSLEQLFDSITSPRELRNRRTFLLEVSEALLLVRAFQQNDHIVDIEHVIGTNSQPKPPAFLIQLRYLVVFPLSVRNNGNITRSQEGLQRAGEVPIVADGKRKH